MMPPGHRWAAQAAPAKEPAEAAEPVEAAEPAVPDPLSQDDDVAVLMSEIRSSHSMVILLNRTPGPAPTQPLEPPPENLINRGR